MRAENDTGRAIIRDVLCGAAGAVPDLVRTR
jgi:hypothetical protein